MTFSGCSSLEGISFPFTVTEIGRWAFLACSKLKSVTLPDSIQHIGNCAFYSCTSLETVNMPYTVQKVDSKAFHICLSLEYIKFHSLSERIKHMPLFLRNEMKLKVNQINDIIMEDYEIFISPRSMGLFVCVSIDTTAKLNGLILVSEVRPGIFEMRGTFDIMASLPLLPCHRSWNWIFNITIHVLKIS